jgi:hypothetical protein
LHATAGSGDIRAVATKYDLDGWIVEALRKSGGTATIPQICESVWLTHEGELRASGDLFFTWQYDIRWAAQRLRDSGVLASPDAAPRGSWRLL